MGCLAVEMLFGRRSHDMNSAYALLSCEIARMVPALQHAVRHQTPWRGVLAGLRESGVLAAVPTWPPVSGQANWLWMVDRGGAQTALDLGSPFGEMTVALSSHFECVIHACPPELAAFTAMRFAQDRLDNAHVLALEPVALPFGESSFDCIALSGCSGHAFLKAGANRRGFEPGLGQLHRLLRSGGLLSLPVERPSRLFRQRAKRRLRRAGFEKIHGYYVDPSAERPRRIIPQRRSALWAFERLRPGSTPRDWLRRVAATCGVHRFAFGPQLLLAYA